jgi:hypothetical protein
VCGRSGALTTQWRQATEDEVDRLNREAGAAESAERTAADARRQAAALLPPSPDVLRAATAIPGVDLDPPRAAWRRWASLPDAGGRPGRVACHG